MKNFRNLIDLSFWDKSGSSFFGLKRKNAKWLALAFIIIAGILVSPLPGPDDLLNIGIAKYLVAIFGISSSAAVALTFSLIPAALFIIGIYIFPYSTKGLFFSYINKLKLIIKKYSKNPIIVLIFIIAMYYLFKYYVSII